MTSAPIYGATFIDKGGTGKTTTTAHIGVALAQDGHDVLLIDLAGKQGDLTKHFGLWETVQAQIEAEEDWPNISTVFADEWPNIAKQLVADQVREMILETEEGPDLIPAHPGLDGIDDKLGNVEDKVDRYSRLERYLEDLIEPLGYDVILIDLPGLTNNVTYNGLWAAQNVITPVETGHFEQEQAAALHQDIEKFNKGFGTDIELTVLVVNKLDRRTNAAREYVNRYQEEYPDAIAPDPVPQSQAISDIASEGRTAYTISNPSKTAREAREAFRSAAQAFVNRVQDHRTLEATR